MGKRNVPRKRSSDSTSKANRRIITYFWIGSFIVMVLAVGLFVRPYFRIASAGDTGNKLTISMSGWDPAVVYAKAGEPISVTLVNLDNSLHTDGAGWHDFVVEEFNVNERVGPGKTRTITFTPTKTGEYTFYCSICCGGKTSPPMRGRLLVS